MESRLGHSFSQVRIHDDHAAHRAAGAVHARAFTLGNHIVFGAGEYAPGTRSGMSLLAHELTHVVQEAGNPIPIMRRAPVLSGRTPAERVKDSIAPDIDKALAESKTITAYIPAKDLKKASGNLEVEFKKTFEKNLEEQEKALGSKPSPPDAGKIVKGFTDLKAGKIHLRENAADVEAAVHETIHLNSKLGDKKGTSAFQIAFSNPLEEGVTQYFTNKVLDEQTLGAGKDYPDELKMAEEFIAKVGEPMVGKAYFKGEQDAIKAVLDAFNKVKRDPERWRTLIRSKDPKDWPEATKELKTVFP